MKRFLALILALVTVSCVTQPARAQVNASVAMDKTNSWLRSTNFFRSNLFAGSGMTLTFGTNGSVTFASSGGSGLTNTFNSGQFTLVNGTNVNLKIALAVTNPFVNLSSLSWLTLTNGAAVANERAWGVLSTGGTDFTIKGLDDTGTPGTGGIIMQRVDENITTASITAANSVTLNSSAVYLIGPSTNGVLFLRPDGILTNAALSGLVYTNGVLSNSVAGGSGTFNANQFGASVLGTNIKSGAIFTNTVNYSLTIADSEAVIFNGNGDWYIGANAIDDWLSFESETDGKLLRLTVNGFEPDPTAAKFDIGTANRPMSSFRGTNAAFSGGLSVTGSATNSALTADRMVYSNGDKVLSSVTATAPVTFSGGTLAVSDMVGDSGAGGSSGLVPAPASGDAAGLKFLRADGLWISPNQVTNNYSSFVTAGVATNVIDMNLAASTNILNGNLTVAHATNGLSSYERTHVRWFWAGGADRTLTIPSGWKTNVFSAVPASITNNTITKMYVTTIGDTSSSANQTNVFVSFEFYK